MSNTRKTRRHPGHNLVKVMYIDQDTWQAAGEPGDIEAWLSTLNHEQARQAMPAIEVTLDEFLRRMAGSPEAAQFATRTAAEGLFVLLMDLDGLRQWWDTEPGKA